MLPTGPRYDDFNSPYRGPPSMMDLFHVRVLRSPHLPGQREVGRTERWYGRTGAEVKANGRFKTTAAAVDRRRAKKAGRLARGRQERRRNSPRASADPPSSLCTAAAPLQKNGLNHPPAGRAQSESEIKLGPHPNGRPWTPAEDAQLLALLNSKMDRPSIARKLKRTVVAITTRLKVLSAKGKL
jgi:hypothetical protein